MPKIYRRKKVENTIYRKMAFGTLSWLTSNTASIPFVSSVQRDSSGRHVLNGWDLTTGKMLVAGGSATNVAYSRVPQVFTGQNTPSNQ